MQLAKIVLCLAAIVIGVNGAKILAIFHLPSKSHYILGSTLLKALAKRGHQVTMISPFALEEPVNNYTDLVMSELLIRKEATIKDFQREVFSLSMYDKMVTMGYNIDLIHKSILNHETINNLIANNETYDLVIQRWAWNALNERMLLIAKKFNAPVIAFCTCGSSSVIDRITATPTPSAYVPTTLMPFTEEMTFWQRLQNALINLAWEPMLRLQYDLPDGNSIDELRENVSLVMVNSHFSIESPRPYNPSVIPVGGMHIQEPKPLPSDVKAFLDDAVDGALFFSLGSNVMSSALPKQMLEELMRAIERLPVRVLWKFEVSGIELPANAMIKNWLPQNDVLAHPNVKAFVTHGGLLSIQEAVYHGVPFVAIPFWGDQEYNIASAVRNGFAIKLDYSDISDETFYNSVMKLLTEKKYPTNIKTRSALFRDQPIRPLDKAVYWVEYVLRHKGAPHLKTQALKLCWYQYLLLDVTAFVIAAIIIFATTIYFISFLLFSWVKRTCRRQKSKKE